MSNVRLTEHQSGITLDFPLSDDAHSDGRRRAWRSFEVGVLFLVGAVFLYASGEGDLAQLRVTGNILVRVTRDQTNHIWYRQEIREFVVEDSATAIVLALELQGGEKSILIHGDADSFENEKLLRAELERIAFVLRQALGTHLEHAIRDLGAQHGGNSLFILN